MGNSLSPTGTINTPQGPIQGLQGDNFRAFLGIPYAQAPVNNLRFSAPQPHPVFTTPFDASQVAPGCPQPSWEGVAEEIQREDCLFLNIFTPRANQTELLPVFFFIHGGGWETGSGMMPLYWADRMANDDTRMIVVTINYRLGALGWLVAEGLNESNLGFQDQQFAMEWVQKNIKSFGGDPQRVTIGGQSAGGISVSVHLTAPSSYPFFSKAIIQSGPPVVILPTVQEKMPFGAQFMRAIGCSTGNMTCLRAASVENILDAQLRVLPLPPIPIPLDQHSSQVLLWSPVVDGQLILDTPQNRINQNKTAYVPTVWGTTRNETAGWVQQILPDRVNIFEYDALIGVLFGRANISAVKEMYPARTSSQIVDQLSQLSCDYIFTCAMRHSARAYAQFGAPVHKYIFMHPPSTDPRCNGTVSHCADIQQTCHGAELDYIFRSADYAGASFTPAEAQLSDQTFSYWLSFIGSQEVDVAWPAYNATLDNSIALDIPDVTTIDGWRKTQCDFWDTWGYYGTIGTPEAFFSRIRDHLRTLRS